MNLTDLIALGASRVVPGTEQPESTPKPKESALGRDDFLNMLLAQLENQDPLDPQDATEFTAQLAQFSMLEQLVSIGEGIGRVEKLLDGATVVPEATDTESGSTP